MDRLERINARSKNAMLVAIRAALNQHEPTLWTALPAFVDSYDAAKGTVTAQPTVQAQLRQPDGKWVDTTLPLCPDCPVAFPGGGGFTLTFPLAQGDEGILVFASRCIDSWWQNGGIQKQAELRMHDLSDGFFIPTGGMSNPNVPSNASTASAQLRSKDGTTYVEIANGQIVNIVAPGGIHITGNVEVSGNLLLGGNIESAVGGTYSGNIRTTGNVIAGVGGADQVGLQTHTHPANNNPPTPGT